MQALVLRWSGRQLTLAGRATLDATDISSSLSTLKPMGSYRIALEGGPVPSLLLTTREGSLQLSGSGRWNGTTMRFDGEASAAPGREDALSNLLNIIGRRDGARSLITLG
jgi:general secretion pathway protein N